MKIYLTHPANPASLYTQRTQRARERYKKELSEMQAERKARREANSKKPACYSNWLKQKAWRSIPQRMVLFFRSKKSNATQTATTV